MTSSAITEPANPITISPLSRPLAQIPSSSGKTSLPDNQSEFKGHPNSQTTIADYEIRDRQEHGTKKEIKKEKIAITMCCRPGLHNLDLWTQTLILCYVMCARLWNES
uniref:Uncharacterized protein n=1 Tax=Sphaerodactylus townsendi TaxID=933632 RepID=A0ACB8F5A1_9SAUR